MDISHVSTSHESGSDKKHYSNIITSLSCIFGYMVYRARQNSTHTQVEYAAQFNISHTALIKIEKGFTSISLDFLQEFALLTGNTLSDLELLAEEILVDLASKGVEIVSSSTSQAVSNRLIKLYGNKFYEKELQPFHSLPNVLLLESLGKAIHKELHNKIFGLVVLSDVSGKEAKTRKVIQTLKIHKIYEKSLLENLEFYTEISGK